MQKVAAYLLERREGVATPEARVEECLRCVTVVRQWLQRKGGDPSIEQGGSYRAEDGGEGKYQWESAQVEGRSWQMLRLDEAAADGRRYVATVSVTNTGASVVVYIAVEAGLSFSTIKPIQIDPRCPRVVRSLLDLPGSWLHGHSRLGKLRRLAGENEGEQLAHQITDQQRAVPILVISESPDAPILSGLDSKIAYDLAGLANTFVVDSAASWGLTGLFGKRFSCFAGGVRIYWPRFSLQDDPFSHPLWTGSRLSAFGENPDATLELFRRQLRQLHMQASALSVLRPREIDDIQGAAKSLYLAGLMERAKSAADFEQLAHAFAKDNDDLRSKLESVTRQKEAISEELEATRTRLSNAELLAPYHSRPDTHIAPLSPDDPEADKGPISGEVRFYKKTHSTAKHDVMQLVADCGCNRWQGANKADKAKKGIERYEGRNDWKSIQHCGSCTGGGMWRVKW